MFGNREVCIALSVAVEIMPLVPIMQLAANFVKRFAGHVDTLTPALYSSPRRDGQPCSTRCDGCVEREAGSAPLRLLLTAWPANPLLLDYFAYLAADSLSRQDGYALKVC
jgi:hypothetical protein